MNFHFERIAGRSKASQGRLVGSGIPSGSERALTAASGALLGTAIAIPLLRVWRSGAVGNQLMGLAKLHNLSPTDNVLALVGLLVASILGAAVSVRLLPTRFFATVRLQYASWAPVAGLLVAADAGTLWGVLSTVVSALCLGFLLAKAPRQERGLCLTLALAHALLGWIFLVRPVLSLLGSPAAVLAALLAISLALAWRLSRDRLALGCYLLSPSAAALPLALFANGPSRLARVGLLAIYGAPILAAIALRLRHVPVWLARFSTFCFLPATFVVLAATVFGSIPAAGDLFEDGHGLLPASEYMRGARPYRDIVPVHGLVTDGVLQLAALRFFGDSYAGLRAGERALGFFFWPLVYFLGLAATRRVAWAFGSALLLFTLFPEPGFLRVMGTLFSLAVLCLAIHRGRSRLWFVVGVLAAIGPLFAVEYGLYTAVAMVAGLSVSRGIGRRNFIAFLGGATLTGIGILAVFAIEQVLKPFLITTVRFLPSLLPVYAAPMPRTPLLPGGSPFVEMTASPKGVDTLFYLGLAAALLVIAIRVTRARALGSSGRILVVLAVWQVMATLSVIARGHTNYALFVAPLAWSLAFLWLAPRGTRHAWTPALVLLLVLLAGPLSVLRDLTARLGPFQIPVGYRRVSEPSRAGEALFDAKDADAIGLIGRFVASGLITPTETWFDFANRPALYYLFDRSCPVRYYEVPLYEAREAQLEVIRALAEDQRVRAALLPAPGSTLTAVDGISNDRRAPLVNAYLRTHFQKAMGDNVLEVWTRR